MKAAPFNIDWMGKRKLFAGLSIAFVIISLFDIFWNGLTLGLDFTGGTLVEVKFPEPVQPEAVRVVLESPAIRTAWCSCSAPIATCWCACRRKRRAIRPGWAMRSSRCCATISAR
jgi:hypothetical protein